MTTEQRASESAIRALIERWSTAVHAGDLEGVLADHSEDIQMFDVPPPNEVRGIEAYRETWLPFFEWQKRGAAFEIVSLDVTAGADVAFATALLRCGTEEELREDPDNRLRLTIGLRKEGDRWVVSHEHHSFPMKSICARCSRKKPPGDRPPTGRDRPHKSGYFAWHDRPQDRAAR